MAPQGSHTDAADPVSVVRRARRGRVHLRRAGGGEISGRPGLALRRGVGRVPLRSRQPEGPVRGAVGAHARLPPLVRRRPGHGDSRALTRRGRATWHVTTRDVQEPALWFRFAGVDYRGREGETLAAALV